MVTLVCENAVQVSWGGGKCLTQRQIVNAD